MRITQPFIMYLTRSLLFLLPVILLFSCGTSKPPGVTTVEPFEGERYMGKWYEIARLDHKFEENLSNVTAEYSLNEDGSIDVRNRGFNTVKNEWEEAIGKAEFVDATDQGRLKVSFFGPFYSGYNVIALHHYNHALVTGEDLDYLWLLSRDTNMPDDVQQRFLQRAQELGYDTSALIWVDHDRHEGGAP